MIEEPVYREHFSGLCAPLAKVLHERHGWGIWLISSYYGGLRGERHVCVSPDKGGLLDALGWNSDFCGGYRERCAAHLVLDDPRIEKITLQELNGLIVARALGGADSSETLARLNEVADELEYRYCRGETGSFKTFDPFAR